MKTDIPIDARFIRRVYRTTLVVWVFVALMVYSRWGWTAVAGLATGTGLALASLRALEWAVRTLMVPDAKANAGGRIVAFGLVKIFVIGAVLTAAIAIGQRVQANLLVLVLGIAGGFFLVHLVMFLKAIGIWLLSHGAAVGPADLRRLKR